MTLLSVVVPVKDEAGNVGPLTARVRDALAAGPPWELVFVDDGSTDGTFAELSALAAADPRVRAVRLRRNVGQSGALRAGLDHAAGDVVATLDGDGQNDPADLPMMLAVLAGGCDAVVGRRAARRDGRLLRRLPSGAANWLLRRATGVPFRDFGCTLRVMTRAAADGLELYGEAHRFITPMLAWGGFRLVQVDVRHHPRTAGRSKYGPGRARRVVLDLLTMLFLARFRDRPMHLFGGAGLAAGGLAVVAAAGAAATTATWRELAAHPLLWLAAGLAAAGGHFVAVGLLAEVAVRAWFEAAGKKPYAVRQVVGGTP